jgi:hypothetical protein
MGRYMVAFYVASAVQPHREISGMMGVGTAFICELLVTLWMSSS